MRWTRESSVCLVPTPGTARRGAGIRRSLALRSVVVVGLATVLSAATAGVADADTVPLPAGVGCEFPLTVTFEGQNVTRHEFATDDGTAKVLLAGKGNNLTFTNEDTGESLFFKSLGYRETTVTNPDGSGTTTSSGTIGLILFPTDSPAGPSTTLIRGRLVYNFTADMTFTVRSLSGT
jgi:hypothetical protein